MNKYSQMESASKGVESAKEMAKKTDVSLSTAPSVEPSVDLSIYSLAEVKTDMSSKSKKDIGTGGQTRPIQSSVIREIEVLNSCVAKAKCNCLGTIHPVLFNCLECGNIICAEEELEVCTFCGAFSRRYRQTHRAEDDENLRKAIESKVGL